MERILEPLLMKDSEQCQIFANSEREYVRTLFIESLMDRIDLQGTVLDLGSGPCDYDIELCKRNSNINIIAVDASEPMLEIANAKIQGYPISLVCDFFENIECLSDITISSLTLHHQNDPLTFWNVIKKNTKKDGKVFVMDMVRPDTISDIDNIVSYLAGNQDETFITDFKNSLAASFTVGEIQEQLRLVGLDLITEVVGKLGVIVLIYGENK